MAFVQRIIEVSVALAPSPKTNQPAKFSESGTNTENFAGWATARR